MTHYYRHYDATRDDQDREKAVADMKEWYGEERFDAIVADLTAYFHTRRDALETERLDFLLGLSGVSGHPVRVMRELIRENISKLEQAL